MNNFVTSQIRTYTPIAAGALASWLATVGLNIDTGAQAGLVVFLTAVLQAVYYFIARLLEKKFPQLGILLGATAQPVYKEPAK